MTRSLILRTLVLALILIASACGAADPADVSSTTSEPTTTLSNDPASSAVGPGISVSEALESTLEGPLLVNGFIVADADGTVVLAELLAESLPPLAGGATLTVVGLDLSTFPGLTTAQGITWSDQPVQLLGEVNDGVLTVSTLSSG